MKHKERGTLRRYDSLHMYDSLLNSNNNQKRDIRGAIGKNSIIFININF